MDKREQIAFILAELLLMDSLNREALTQMCRVHWNYTGGMSESDLMAWEDERLDTLYKMMQGMRMTREYVPDIITAYGDVDGVLPSKVSFGRMPKESLENDSND